MKFQKIRKQYKNTNKNKTYTKKPQKTNKKNKKRKKNAKKTKKNEIFIYCRYNDEY